MTDIKICGLSTPETLDAAVDAGATHVGFVHFEKSPRHVTLEQASKLRRRVPESVKLVLVTVAMQPEPLARAYEAIRPDVIQFHGSETPERTNNIRARTGIEVMKVIKLAGPGDLAAAASYRGAADRFLFDAMAPKDRTDALPGGNALAFDWTLLSGAEMALPWMLAGGLTAENLKVIVMQNLWKKQSKDKDEIQDALNEFDETVKQYLGKDEETREKKR